jgi:hypothetical protein
MLSHTPLLDSSGVNPHIHTYTEHSIGPLYNIKSQSCNNQTITTFSRSLMQCLVKTTGQECCKVRLENVYLLSVGNNIVNEMRDLTY